MKESYKEEDLMLDAQYVRDVEHVIDVPEEEV